MINDNQEIKSKVDKLEKSTVKKDEVNDILNQKIKELKDFIREEFVERISNVEKMIKEKDGMIKTLESKLEKLVESKSEEKFNCTLCDFETYSKHGLKVHIKRKHSILDKDKFPAKCDLCEEEVLSKKEMRKHMVTHSYKKACFKCEECDFVCEKEETIEVHVKKFHSEIIECGLCEYEATSQEDLDTHLFTCEVFDCYYCYLRFKKLETVKQHIKKEHTEFKYQWDLTHLKMDSNSFTEVCKKSYKLKDV